MVPFFEEMLQVCDVEMWGEAEASCFHRSCPRAKWCQTCTMWPSTMTTFRTELRSFAALQKLRFLTLHHWLSCYLYLPGLPKHLPAPSATPPSTIRYTSQHHPLHLPAPSVTPPNTVRYTFLAPPVTRAQHHPLHLPAPSATPPSTICYTFATPSVLRPAKSIAHPQHPLHTATVAASLPTAANLTQ